jgi:hypothetical protein
MKFLFVFLLSLSSIYAMDLTCLQLEGQETQGMIVKAEIKGSFEVSSEARVTFSTISFEYLIDEDGDYVWSRGRQLATDLSNYENYRPRVYKNHMKFSQLVHGDYQSEYNGFGDLDLIIPSEILLSKKAASFTSYLIMTYMDDHFGGTISLNCEIH